SPLRRRSSSTRSCSSISTASRISSSSSRGLRTPPPAATSRSGSLAPRRRPAKPVAVTGSTQTVPISVALVAGALVALNPCSLPLLPPFLSYYLGVEREPLPRARNGLGQGLIVGGLLTAGVVGVFVVIGLPLVYGASRVADAVPWLGLAVGLVAVLAGLVSLRPAPIQIGRAS